MELNRQELLLIYTGLEKLWKEELNRDKKVSKAEEIDKLRAKIMKEIEFNTARLEALHSAKISRDRLREKEKGKKEC